MSLADNSSSSEPPSTCKQTSPLSPDDETKLPLPPAILLRILHVLPVPSLAQLALVSRELKTLVYQDVIWRQKLRCVLEYDTTGLDEALSLSVHDSSAVLEEGIYMGYSPSIFSHLLETGLAREKFKRLYALLVPYYADLRHAHWETNKVLTEYGSQPRTCAQWLKRLQAFGACSPLDDSRQINEALEDACKYFESASLQEFEIAYDANNIETMKLFAKGLVELNGGAICRQTYFQKNYLLCDNPFAADDNFKGSDSLKPLKTFLATVQEEFLEQSRMISEIFPDETMDTYYVFVDRILEDVQPTAHRDERKQVSEYLANPTVLPRTIDHERGINLLYKLFIPFLDDYLAEEEAYIKESSRALVDEWMAATADQPSSSGARLTNQTREMFKRNYLLAFKKVITVPVDLFSTAAITIASPFQRSTSDIADTPSPVRSLHSRQSSRQSLQQSTADARTPTSELKTAMHAFDAMQDFLSLDTVLQLIHLNKDAERRMDQLMSIGFPGRMEGDIQRTYEHIFVHLLKALGGHHIKPAFDRAIEHLATYTPSLDSILISPGDVAPLTEFFEMVHVGDVIQQMVQLYYDEAITKHVDKQDFMSEINKEKKVFERILDDAVACGMDKSIQARKVEYILTHEQDPRDYHPTEDVDMDLRPTKACHDAIECLRSNTSLLHGAAEKATMDLFFSEVGRRFAEILCKHLKTLTISEKGGFQYISDINAYHDFIQSLRQKTVTQYFSALKCMANIYIVSSPQDIKEMVHDLKRYDNHLSLEDMIEFASCRNDWPSVKKVVMKDMTECSLM
ncbi:exocyst complex component Sec10-domain-containing protein [Dichotomocladium elegans]|nr:exocyst complex component Sec10-domain-containing protein [Dichotomocladium elegans]